MKTSNNSWKDGREDLNTGECLRKAGEMICMRIRRDK